MGTDRITRIIPGFNSYITTTDDYQKLEDPVSHIANYERLGLIVQNSTDWSAKRVAWVALYAKYCDATTCTRAVKANVNQFIKDFRAFANPLLNKMSSSGAATHDDELVFNFKATRSKPTHHNEPISKICYVRFIPVGGGVYKVHCYDNSDASRASVTDGADGVMMYWTAIDPVDMATSGKSDDSELSGKVKAPMTAGECQKQFMYSGASFTFDPGEGSVGKKLFYFVRWFNSKHPELAGPVTGPFMMVIA
jgi:hypothetical protein